jgi:hypothetical protein
MPYDKEKHTPESVAAKVVKALLKIPSKEKPRRQARGRKQRKQEQIKPSD